MTRWMNKVDPDSLRGRVFLLLLDKLIIGALLATAFVVYDQWKTNELRRSEALFKKGAYLRSLVPSILDKTMDLSVRGALFESLIEADALDPTSTFSLAERIVRSESLEQHSRGLGTLGAFEAPTALRYQPLYPGLLRLIPRQTQAFVDYLDTRMPSPLVARDKSERVAQVVDEEVAHFWRIFFRAAMHASPDRDLRILNADAFLARYLPGLWELGKPLPFGMPEGATRYGFARDDWERRSVKGLRILGAMGTIEKCGSGCDGVTLGHPRRSAKEYLQTICTSMEGGEDQRELAEALKRLLKAQLEQEAKDLIRKCGGA
jgi:hypothetical protein